MYYDYRCYENENDLVTTQLYDLAQFTAIEFFDIQSSSISSYVKVKMVVDFIVP